MQNSFVPVARIVERQPHLLKQAKLDEQTEWAKYENMTLSTKAKANIHHKAHTGLRIYHYHTDHLGTPQELTNDRGEVDWLNYKMAWGGSFSQLNHVYNLDGLDVSADELQPIRFQGQFYDVETNLHYNRFRYYDSDVGMFISRDPIGLMGGFNVFQYAPNPVGWIDPFGLAKLFETGTYGSLNGGDHVGDGLQAHELIRHEALVQNGLAQKSTRLSGNPSIALDLDHHTRGPLKDSRGIGGAHYHEAEIRQTQYSLVKNDIHPSMKRDMDITQGSLRKAGVPTPIVKRLRKEANKFYRELLKKKSKCTS